MRKKITYFLLPIALLFFLSCSDSTPKKTKKINTEAAQKAKLIGNMLDELATSLISAADGKAEVIRTAEGVNITFQPDFYFESSTAELNPNAKGVLGRISGVLNQYPYTELFIEGHADSSGNQNFNVRLSQLRAKNVAVFMRDNGVKASRMAIAGYGATRPITTNDTPDGRRQNRRVLVKIRAKEDEFLQSVKKTDGQIQH